MRLSSVMVALLCAFAAPALAQSPPSVAPPDKIAPDPIRPEGSTPPNAAAPSESASPSDAPSVSPNVTAARIAGPWQADGKKGFSRVVAAMDGDVQRLFVQWIVEPDAQVLQTQELKDDDAAKLTFGDIRAEPENGQMTVFLDTVPDKDGMRDTWLLVIGGPGDARFGPATN